MAKLPDAGGSPLARHSKAAGRTVYTVVPNAEVKVGAQCEESNTADVEPYLRIYAWTFPRYFLTPP